MSDSDKEDDFLDAISRELTRVDIEDTSKAKTRAMLENRRLIASMAKLREANPEGYLLEPPHERGHAEDAPEPKSGPPGRAEPPRERRHEEIDTPRVTTSSEERVAAPADESDGRREHLEIPRASREVEKERRARSGKVQRAPVPSERQEHTRFTLKPTATPADEAERVKIDARVDPRRAPTQRKMRSPSGESPKVGSPTADLEADDPPSSRRPAGPMERANERPAIDDPDSLAPPPDLDDAPAAALRDPRSPRLLGIFVLTLGAAVVVGVLALRTALRRASAVATARTFAALVVNANVGLGEANVALGSPDQPGDDADDDFVLSDPAAGLPEAASSDSATATAAPGASAPAATAESRSKSIAATRSASEARTRLPIIIERTP